jgi:hypothetical protein
MTGANFYTAGSSAYKPTSNTGLAIGMRFASNELWLSDTYISNAQFSSSAIVSNATLSDIGLTSGTFEYAVGGNTVTVSVGQLIAAVPESSTWVMLLVGFGMIGATARHRRKGVKVRYA